MICHMNCSHGKLTRALAKQVVLVAIAAIDVLVDSCPIDYVCHFLLSQGKGGRGGEGEEPGRRRSNNRLAHNFQIIIFPRVLAIYFHTKF